MNYFFIGIKGSGMSALAIIMKQLGNNVIGSDIDEEFFTEKNLKKEEIKTYNFGEFDFSNIDVVVLGNAFNEEHIDYVKAKEKGIKIIKYYELLNEVIKKNDSIAISGTNGKTTTTGLLVSSFSDVNPSFLIGDGTGYGNKDSDLFLFEACEYKNTFLNYDPEMILINNIEFDHPDFFKDLDDVIDSFNEFSSKSKIVVINGDDTNCLKIVHDNIFSFGLDKNNDLYAKDVVYDSHGINFELVYNKENLGKFNLPFYGEHMLYNSLAVILCNLIKKRDIDLIIKNISTFKGVDRRFNEKEIVKEVFLIDDYAHHATAIDLTIKAVRQKFPNYKLVSIFQPHTYSRVVNFKEEFAKSLINSDEIILLDVFASAREKDNGVSSKLIEDEIYKLNKEDKLVEFSKYTGKEEKIVFCLLGAGNIDILYKNKIESLFKERV